MTAHSESVPVSTAEENPDGPPTPALDTFRSANGVTAEPLSGGIMTLALAGALITAATIIMTATTALHWPWPDAAFRSLAALLLAAVLFAHVRNLSARNAAFACGVVAGIAPSLWIAAHHALDHWDDFMTWLGNALYIWKFGAFPTDAAPPVASVWPGYPPGSSIVLAAIWSAAGRLVENAGPLINVACLAILPGIALRAAGRDLPVSAIGCAVIGAMLGLGATTLNPGLDWHWVLSCLPETVMLVAFAVAFVLTAELRFSPDPWQRAHLAALAAILALIANLKQTGLVFVVLLMLAALLVTWSWNSDEKNRFWRPVFTLALVCVPTLAVWLSWHIYRTQIFPAGAFAYHDLNEWHFEAIPDLLRSLGRRIVDQWLLFVPIAAAAMRGWFVLGRRWIAGHREVTAADRLAALFALVQSGFLAFTIVTYVGAFSEKEARGTAEFFRYQSTLGAAGLIVALALIMERLPRPLPARSAPIALVAVLAIVATILPAAGVYPGKAIYDPEEMAQLREIGRVAAETITRSETPVTVELVHDAGYLAVLIVRYEIWARAPSLVRSISGYWAGKQLPVRFINLRRYATYALALEHRRGNHCAVLDDKERLALIGPTAEAPMCQPLLSHLKRLDAKDRRRRTS
jgi:hypothetical protein